MRFIEENWNMRPAGRLYQIMNVSPRGYRAYRSRPISQRQRQRQREDIVLLAHIREQHRLSLQSYTLHSKQAERRQEWSTTDDRRVKRDLSEHQAPIADRRFHRR